MDKDLAAPSGVLATPAVGLAVTVLQADYANVSHAQALVQLLDMYAQDPMGGSKALGDFAIQNLVAELARRPNAFSILAFVGGVQAGLVNCFEGFSTFACKPLVNVHDLAVAPAFRGQGIARRMLQGVEKIAQERGACKLTLEVLQGNAAALRSYQQFGFSGYQLNATVGQAVFLQKWLV